MPAAPGAACKARFGLVSRQRIDETDKIEAQRTQAFAVDRPTKR
jgi:hypothetical protein